MVGVSTGNSDASCETSCPISHATRAFSLAKTGLDTSILERMTRTVARLPACICGFLGKRKLYHSHHSYASTSTVVRVASYFEILSCCWVATCHFTPRFIIGKVTKVTDRYAAGASRLILVAPHDELDAGCATSRF